MNLITADMLLERGAFCSQVKVVREHWPDGVVPSLAVCLEAAELRLDLDWFAQHFLSAKAGRNNLADIAEAWRIYWADIDEPRRIYWAALDEAWRIYWEDTDEPRRIYRAAIAEPRRICLAAKAEALWTAWQIDNPEPRSEP